MGKEVMKLVLILLVLVGCDISPTSEPISEDEIWGTYTANFHAGLNETIELRSDHTYLFVFKRRDGSEFRISESLRFGYHDSTRLRPFVRLNNFAIPYPSNGPCYTTDPRLASLDTSRFIYGLDLFKSPGGKIELVRCPTENQYYVKQKI